MELLKMSYLYTKDVTVISKEQFEVHDKLYEKYVDKVNEIEKQLENKQISETANSTYSIYRGLKRGETFALDAVILHELYFENIGGINGVDVGIRNERFATQFGNFDEWAKDFKATAMASRGWAVLAFEQRSRSYINISLDAHDYGMITYAYPVLVLDMYEHAYYIDYRSNKAEYIDRFMKNINWEVVKQRISRI